MEQLCCNREKNDRYTSSISTCKTKLSIGVCSCSGKMNTYNNELYSMPYLETLLNLKLPTQKSAYRWNRNRVGLNSKFFEYNSSNSYSGGVAMKNEMKQNLDKLDTISKLNDDWDGNGSKKFGEGLIAQMKELIYAIKIQPEIFPTSCDCIQFEYEKENGEYLEFELYDGGKLNIFRVFNDGREESENTVFDMKRINKVVEEFYG